MWDSYEKKKEYGKMKGGESTLGGGGRDKKKS